MRRAAALSLLTGILSCGLLLRAGSGADARPQSAAQQSSERLGKINFPTSCKAGAQGTFLKGVALLHSFQYTEAEQTFAEATKQDSQCAMAYWGKAMSRYHQLWDFPKTEALTEGRGDLNQAQKVKAVTEREREYIQAAAVFYFLDAKETHAAREKAYSSAMEKLYDDDKTDVEAGAFYALSLISLAEGKHDSDAYRKKAIETLDKLIGMDPDNPGVVHYMIHACDTPKYAPLGLVAARKYAKIAPDSAHALHMPSHIFTGLGLWQESIESNLAAAAAASKAIEMHMAEVHYETHPMDFLDYAYLQSGQEEKARQVVEEVKRVPGATAEQIADEQAIFSARNAMELHRWNEAAHLAVPQVRLIWQDSTYSARAIGAARSGDVHAARFNTNKLIEVIAARRAHETEQGNAVLPGESVDQGEAEAWLAFADGKTDEALKIMRGAAEREESEDMESLSMPAREMLADMLLELKRPTEALTEYKAALKESPNRFDAIYGAAHAAESAGDTKTARAYYSQLVGISSPNANRPELHEARMYLAKNSN